MWVISRKKLREFWEIPTYADSEQPLKAWFLEASKATWNNPNEIKAKYGNASVVGNNRIVFNICGNKYRLIVEIHYEAYIVKIRFIGTHKEYDDIDATTI
jgi:mRNA interferase HigB